MRSSKTRLPSTFVSFACVIPTTMSNPAAKEISAVPQTIHSLNLFFLFIDPFSWWVLLALFLAQLLEYILNATTNLGPPLLGIGPRRQRRFVRINHGQCLFGVLTCQVFPSIFQIGIGQVIVRVRRVRISEKIELEDLDGGLDVALALVVLADDVHGNLRPQLRVRIFFSS